jgi:hypothetical protein
MTEDFVCIYKIRLENDKIFLSVTDGSTTPDVEIDVPTIAILTKIGDLVIYGEGGAVSEYHAVLPSTTTLPVNCKHLAFFGLEKQIVIFRPARLKRHFGLQTSQPDFYTKQTVPIPDSFKALLPHDTRDTIVLYFENKQVTLLVLQPSDALVFMKVLDQPVAGESSMTVYQHPLKFSEI